MKWLLGTTNVPFGLLLLLWFFVCVGFWKLGGEFGFFGDWPNFVVDRADVFKLGWVRRTGFRWFVRRRISHRWPEFKTDLWILRNVSTTSIAINNMRYTVTSEVDLYFLLRDVWERRNERLENPPAEDWLEMARISEYCFECGSRIPQQLPNSWQIPSIAIPFVVIRFHQDCHGEFLRRNSLQFKSSNDCPFCGEEMIGRDNYPVITVRGTECRFHPECLKRALPKAETLKPRTIEDETRRVRKESF